MAELLLELYSEEIPPRLQIGARSQLKQLIENAFKELHEGLYTWGDIVFKESIKQGYIESADGWKLALPKFDKFKEYKEGRLN